MQMILTMRRELTWALVLLMPGILAVKECRVSFLGFDYQGEVSKTISGRTCQSWSSQFPHAHNFNESNMFPDPSMDYVANHCRNPDDRLAGPWCFTTDPDTEWERCEIPRCHDYPECKLTDMGSEYRGSLGVTASGRSCLAWQTFPSLNSSFLQENFCRNPDDKDGGPWCYVSEEAEWEHCQVPICKPSMSCKQTDSGTEYVGTISLTGSGGVCQRWDRQAPHEHDFTDVSLFPDATLEDAVNYCRNPDHSPDGPWCFTTDPDIPRESCNIQTCQDCKTSSLGRDYSGRLDTSRSGLPCQRWDQQTPHPHHMTDPNRFPDANLVMTENFCRNPDRKEGGPWCYTQDDFVEWDYCDIPLCDGTSDDDIHRVPIARHVLHIGIDGLRPDCMANAIGGAPNMLERLALGGSYTLTNARTVLQTVSAPGWSATMCGMGIESTGITGNGWLPPWQGSNQAISPAQGRNTPIPCGFQTMKAQDATLHTASFYDWYWIKYMSAKGFPDYVDKDRVCLFDLYPICDAPLTWEMNEYLRNILHATEKSYSFIYLGTVDGIGHGFNWCSLFYDVSVAYMDYLVGLMLDVIEEECMDDEVMILLSADHGGEGNGHGRMQDSDLLIPMFLKGPGIRHNHTLEHTVENRDMVPTATYALGLKQNPWWTGKVMREAFENL